MPLKYLPCAGDQRPNPSLDATHRLKIVRPFPLKNSGVLLQLPNIGPGILGRDRYRTGVVVETDTKVVIVNPTATKLH